MKRMTLAYFEVIVGCSGYVPSFQYWLNELKLKITWQNLSWQVFLLSSTNQIRQHVSPIWYLISKLFQRSMHWLHQKNNDEIQDLKIWISHCHSLSVKNNHLKTSNIFLWFLVICDIWPKNIFWHYWGFRIISKLKLLKNNYFNTLLNKILP